MWAVQPTESDMFNKAETGAQWRGEARSPSRRLSAATSDGARAAFRTKLIFPRRIAPRNLWMTVVGPLNVTWGRSAPQTSDECRASYVHYCTNPLLQLSTVEAQLNAGGRMRHIMA